MRFNPNPGIWDEKSWADLERASGLLLQLATKLDNRVGGGGGGFEPEEAIKLLDEIATVVEFGTAAAEWAK